MTMASCACQRCEAKRLQWIGLRALLVKAFGAEWTAASEAKLLKDAGSEGVPLGAMAARQVL
jgi:hypothetical protein